MTTLFSKMGAAVLRLRGLGVSRIIELVVLSVAEWRHKNLWVSTLQSEFEIDSSDAPTVRNFFSKAGVSPGDTVMIHSSWNHLKHAYGSPELVIEDLLNYLGPTGTLTMPAIPLVSVESGIHINFDRVVSGAGLISEVFRRMPGVVRSISYNHSVSALGPYSEFLTGEHHLGLTSWDHYSPYRRLASIPNSWVVGFGVGLRLRSATALHCVESELTGIPYFAKLFSQDLTYSYFSSSYGSGEVTQLVRRGANYGPKIAKYFSREELCEETAHGVDFYAIRAPLLIKKSIELGKAGKTMYLWPIPWPWCFKSPGRWDSVEVKPLNRMSPIGAKLKKRANG